MKLAMIVAASTNNVIGVDNQLPWHLPKDLQFFKSVTMGKPIIMGRKTFDSIGRPLPGRTNIVITRQKDWSHDGVLVCHSMQEALALASGEAADEAMLIGGAELYRQAFAEVHKLYLTRVHAEVDGDAFMPEVKGADWRELSREKCLADGSNLYDYSFITYERVTD